MYDFPSEIPENDIGSGYGSILATASSSYDTVGGRSASSHHSSVKRCAPTLLHHRARSLVSRGRSDWPITILHSCHNNHCRSSLILHRAPQNAPHRPLDAILLVIMPVLAKSSCLARVENSSEMPKNGLTSIECGAKWGKVEHEEDGDREA